MSESLTFQIEKLFVAEGRFWADYVFLFIATHWTGIVLFFLAIKMKFGHFSDSSTNLISLKLPSEVII